MVLAFSVHGRDCPVRDSNGKAEDNDKKDVGFESATIDNGNDTLQDIRDTNNESSEVRVGEVAIALREADERGVFDGRRGSDTDWRERHGDGARRSTASKEKEWMNEQVEEGHVEHLSFLSCLS